MTLFAAYNGFLKRVKAAARIMTRAYQNAPHITRAIIALAMWRISRIALNARSVAHNIITLLLDAYRRLRAGAHDISLNQRLAAPHRVYRATLGAAAHSFSIIAHTRALAPAGFSPLSLLSLPPL